MLRAEDISIGYGGKVLAEGIDFSLGPGECVLLCGANGSGKSTLLRVLAGMDRAMKGRVVSDSGVIMLPTGIPKVRGFTVREFIRAACFSGTDIWGRCPAGMEKKISRSLGILGIGGLAGHELTGISDGEFQKACIASALARDASVLLLDEPTVFLDVDSRMTVMETLRGIAEEEKIAVLYSSHDIHESASSCSRILGISLESRFLDSGICGKEKVLSSCFRKYR